MFGIDIEGMRRRVFETPEITIGRSTRCELVLPSPEVSRSHAQLVQRNGFVLEDLGSASGTWVDDIKIRKQRLTRENQIRIGPFTLAIVPDAAPDPTELRLLAAIASQQDAESRLVYADWLEQQCDHTRAEFLRLQERLVVPPDPLDPEVVAQSKRLRLLATSIDMAWRYRVARPAIEGCETQFSFQCPRDWGSLAETQRSDVRHCTACNKDVCYCSTAEQARQHMGDGRCVAVDIITIRTPGDLEPDEFSNRPPSPMMDAVAPPETGPIS